MKIFTTILTVLIAMTITTNAQIPNSGFENWTTVGSYEDPMGWASTNSYSTGSLYAITKSTEHYPAIVGSYSVKIQSNTSLLPNISGYGMLMTKPFSGDPIPTFPIIGHPTSLTGYYKFAPQNGDMMCIKLNLFNAGVSVSEDYFTTTASVPNWTSFSILISNYSSADSARILIATSWDLINEKNSVPQGNSVLYIDNLNFDNLITSVSEQTSENTALSLYPNPASDFFTLNIDNRNNDDLILNLYNGTGTLVKSGILKQNQRQINIEDLSNGIYVVEIKSKGSNERQKLLIQR